MRSDIDLRVGPLARLDRRLRSLGGAVAALMLTACTPETIAVLGPESSGSCGAIGDVVDADDDWGTIFAGTSGCVRIERFPESGVAWTIQSVRGNRPGPLFVVLHDDEQTALDTAAYAFSRYGGTVVAVETGGERRNGVIDPNRNFNVGKSRCGGPPTVKFTSAILDSRRAEQPIIALHTNQPGAAGTGGGGDISLSALPSNAEAFRSARAAGGLASEDAFILVASTGGPGEERIRRTVEQLNARGINVVVETVERGGSDCSLSNYTALHGITRYYNIEVPEGAGSTQRRMVDQLLGLLRGS